MQNNFGHSLLVCLAISAVAPLHADDKNAKPDAEPISRYQLMIDRSPFALASETALPSSAPENVEFTKDLVLTGAVRLNGGEYITIESKDHNQRFSLKNGETYNEISLVSVAWSDAVGKTKATLKRGTEFGMIGFDEAAARTGAMAPLSGNGGVGGTQGQPQDNTPAKAQLPQPPNMAPTSMKGTGQNSIMIRRDRSIPLAPDH